MGPTYNRAIHLRNGPTLHFINHSDPIVTSRLIGWDPLPFLLFHNTQLKAFLILRIGPTYNHVIHL